MDTKQTVKRQPRLLVFAGAGASVDSGLPAFRKTNVTWDDGDVMWGDRSVYDICNYLRLEQLHERGKAAYIHEFYQEIYEKIKLAEPNAFHYLIRDILNSGVYDVRVITTNVDDLFERAGVPTERVHHLHGSILKNRCRRCQETFSVDQKECLKHDSLVATDTVFYGENVSYYRKGKRSFDRLCSGDTILMVGSSGETFTEAKEYWAKCRSRGVHTINVNPYGHPHHLYPSDDTIYHTIQHALPNLRKYFV